MEGEEVREEILEDGREAGGEGAGEEVIGPREVLGEDAGGAVSDYYGDYGPEETMEDDAGLGQGADEAVNEVFQAVADGAVEEAMEDGQSVVKGLEDSSADIKDVAGLPVAGA